MDRQRCLRILLTASLLLTLAASASPTLTVIYVDHAAVGTNDGTSWANAYLTVRQAVTRAVSGNEIWVAHGTYVNGSQTLKSRLALYGGFDGTETSRTERDPAVNVTILDGNQQGAVIIIPPGATNATTVDGFWITNGTGNPSTSSCGGGICCAYASATISNNVIYGNSATYGGGIYVEDSASPVITDNLIYYNCAWEGGGVHLHNSGGNVQRNCISDNDAGAGGGVYVDESDVTIASNLIAANYADGGGGGVYMSQGAPLLINNTIYANDTSDEGGGIYCVTALIGPKIQNNIVTVNTRGGIFGTGGGVAAIVVTYNDVYANTIYETSGVTLGGGNIAVDPLFVAPLTNDFRLQSTSPCRDAGDNANVVVAWTDLDGNQRIYPTGGWVDMGALEYIYVLTPTFSPVAGTYTSAQSVTISTTTSGAHIHYTTDGTDPTGSSPLYSTPIAVSVTTTVKALGSKAGMNDSAIASALYTIQICETPTFDPDGGTYTSAQSVTIATTTPGAHIHYTTDGTDPTGASPLYSAPVDISADTTLKAIASLAAWGDSPIKSADYVITGTVATPTFDPVAGTYTSTQTVTISTTTSGAHIHYTTDGTDPTGSSPLYSAPVSVAVDTTLKAKGYKTDWADSAIGTAAYVITGTVATPTFSPVAGTYTSAQSVTISTTTSGAHIHYTTDGTDPDSGSTLYSAPVAVAVDTTLKAKAYKTDWTDSAIGTAAYVITGTVATPTFDPVAGTYTSTQTVTITTTTAGAHFHYTTDGTDPTESSTLYTGALTISVTTTVKAKAYKTDWADSAIGTAAYVITGTVATPTFSPVAGTYTSAQSVTISTTTSGAHIHYTTDGTDPDGSSPLYSAPVAVTVDTTLKAKAYKTDWIDSAIGTAAYVITGTVATPTFDPVAGTYASAQSVTITTTTAGAHFHYTTDGTHIHYTTDGTDPTGSSPLYSAPVAITVDTTLKAKAYKTDWADSAIGTAVYYIGDYPVNVSLSPTSGTLVVETKLTFTAVYSDSHGYSHLRSCYLLINTTSSCLKAAYVRYDPVTNKLYMRNDGNTSWMGGYAPGAVGKTIANGYGRIYCNETTVVKSGNTITVTWKIALKSPYGLRPTCKGYMYCVNVAGNHAGWDEKGTYSVH